MMDFKIINVSESNNCLIVRVDHHNPDTSFWFTENYCFQGREGLKQKRAVNGEGEILMDNGAVAPLNGEGTYYLPSGRTWMLLPAPHMDDESILTVIRSIHTQRLVSGWPQGRVDVMRPAAFNQNDIDGCPTLITTFASLIGVEE